MGGRSNYDFDKIFNSGAGKVHVTPAMVRHLSMLQLSIGIMYVGILMVGILVICNRFVLMLIQLYAGIRHFVFEVHYIMKHCNNLECADGGWIFTCDQCRDTVRTVRMGHSCDCAIKTCITVRNAYGPLFKRGKNADCKKCDSDEAAANLKQ